MYDAFDEFLSFEGWHRLRPFDERRFYSALDKVVWSERFDPEDLANYLRAKASRHAPEVGSSGQEHALIEKAIQQLHHTATLIRNFIHSSKSQFH